MNKGASKVFLKPVKGQAYYLLKVGRVIKTVVAALNYLQPLNRISLLIKLVSIRHRNGLIGAAVYNQQGAVDSGHGITDIEALNIVPESCPEPPAGGKVKKPPWPDTS